METKFKIGDYVVRTAHSNNSVQVGKVYRVTGFDMTSFGLRYSAGYGLFLEGVELSFSPAYFELHKESKVLQILRQYRDNKRPDKQAVRDSGIQPDL